MTDFPDVPSFEDGLDLIRIGRARLDAHVVVEADALARYWLTQWAEHCEVYGNGPRRDFIKGLLCAFPLPHPGFNDTALRLVYGLVAILDEEAG